MIRSRMKGRSLWLLLAAGFVALLANVIFYRTYPINVGQSDNPSYLAMIITGSSNLIHTSGYGATIYLLARKLLPILPSVAIPNGLPSDVSASWFGALQTVQLVLHLSLFSLSIFLCAKVFGKLPAAVLALAWGCNVLFISNVNATAPEWLQGHALLLAVLLHAYARKLTLRKKVLVYCLAAGVFGVAYLIKPNSLLFAISLVAFVLLDKESWRFKVLQVASSVAVFLSVTWAYANFYHYRSTGATQLTFDHAWVLTDALPPDYFSSAAAGQLGIDSLRWASMARVTPPEYFRAGGIENINYGAPPDIRREYKEKWDHMLRLSRDQMVQFVRDNPPPPGYRQGGTAVPAYYYYGLERTDALGIRVYMESLQSHPWFHIQRAGNALITFFLGRVKGVQPFPTFTDPVGFTFLPPDFSSSVLGRTKIVPPPEANPYFLPYYNPSNTTVSYYGVKAIETLNAVTSASFLYLGLNIIALLGLFRLKSDMEKITVFSLVTAIGAFASASGMLLGLRQKELISMTPVYFLVLSLTLISFCEALARTSRQQPALSNAESSSRKSRLRK
jgi:hypothetical protein